MINIEEGGKEKVKGERSRKRRDEEKQKKIWEGRKRRKEKERSLVPLHKNLRSATVFVCIIKSLDKCVD